MQHATSLLILALLQSGWTLTPAPPREVRRLYWELIPEMEVWVRLVPEGQERRPLVNLVFHAFYPGRAARDWYTGLPAWPLGVPSRLTISAEPPPQTIVRALSLRVTVDDRTIDFTGLRTADIASSRASSRQTTACRTPLKRTCPPRPCDSWRQDGRWEASPWACRSPSRQRIRTPSGHSRRG